MTTALLITTEDKFEKVEFENSLAFFYKHIGCDIIEIARPRALRQITGLSEEYIMVVDEESLCKGIAPKLNIFASAFCGACIYGNVMIVKEVETSDGYDFAGLTDEDHANLSLNIAELLDALEKRYYSYK